MNANSLPLETQELLSELITLLQSGRESNLQPRQRLALLHSLGPFTAADNNLWYSLIAQKQLLALSFADRVRARIAWHTANKVVPLWKTALSETQALYQYDEEIEGEERLREQIYQEQASHQPIEYISVFSVPRLHIPDHIMKMTRQAWLRAIIDEEAFLYEANEWWEIYPGGGGSPREIAIKWAAQESLYAITGRVNYHRNSPLVYSSSDMFNIISDGPSGYAALAFADPVITDRHIVSQEKLRRFWLWWLTEVFP